MKKTWWTLVGAVGLAVALSAAPGFSAILVDDEGVGFVGKGDVQLLFGWNNAELQKCANSIPDAPTNAGCLEFYLEWTSVKVTEKSWVCTNSKNEHTQERERTTTTTSTAAGVSASVDRHQAAGG